MRASRKKKGREEKATKIKERKGSVERNKKKRVVLTKSSISGMYHGCMRVHIATDHAGYELKTYLLERLAEAGHEVVDHGAYEYDAWDDYPPMCFECGQAVVSEPGSLGIVIGGSGNGEQIAANKVKGVRAGLAWNIDTAKLAREHNDANVIAIGARQHSPEEAWSFVKAFLSTPFSGDERHQRRIDLLSAYENR